MQCVKFDNSKYTRVSILSITAVNYILKPSEYIIHN